MEIIEEKSISSWNKLTKDDNYGTNEYKLRVGMNLWREFQNSTGNNKNRYFTNKTAKEKKKSRNLEKKITEAYVESYKDLKNNNLNKSSVIIKKSFKEKYGGIY